MCVCVCTCIIVNLIFILDLIFHENSDPWLFLRWNQKHNHFVFTQFISFIDVFSGLGIDVMCNLSPRSGLSIGDEDTERNLNENAMHSLVDVLTMRDQEANLDEATNEDPQLPLMETNVSDDLCFTSEDNGEYGDFQCDNSILDDIAINILDPDSNIMSIFEETMESTDLLPVGTEGRLFFFSFFAISMLMMFLTILYCCRL